MRKSYWVLALVLLAAPALSMRAFAADNGCCKGMNMCMQEKMGGMCGKMEQMMDLDEMFYHKAALIKENAAELGITDDQMQRVKMLEMDVKKSVIKNKADIDIVVLDFEEAIGKDDIDVAAANMLVEKKYANKIQEAKMLVSAYADLKKVLSKDQMKKLHDIWNKKKMDDTSCMMMGGKKDMMGGKKDMMGGMKDMKK